jgi:alpha-L-rhamnosidase
MRRGIAGGQEASDLCRTGDWPTGWRACAATWMAAVAGPQALATAAVAAPLTTLSAGCRSSLCVASYVFRVGPRISGPAGWSSAPVPFTVDGTEGVAASAVVSARVTMPASAAGGPVPLTVTATADGLSARTQLSMIGFGSWPAGTTATASSYHPPNTVNGQVRTYVPGNAIDGNPSTFWNDANPAIYPAVLTVTSPSPVTLDGMAFASFPDGVPVDFTVSTWDGIAWVQQAQVTGNDLVDRWIPFTAAVATTQVQLAVTLDQNAYAGEFTRVAELDP